MRGKNVSAEDLTTKKELALEVIRRLKAEYPDAGCTLDYDHAWQLLVSVRLAAQCTDARVNIVVQDLFAKYPSVAALAEAEPEDIEAIVKPCGLGRSKARDISACMRMLRDKYDCKVPTTFEELLALPGVGRKTANVLGAVLWQKEVMPVDTHVFRVSERIGLTTRSKTPLQTELTLEKNIPGHLLPLAHHWLILHGRYVCVARAPKCDECGIATWCRKYASDHRQPKTLKI
jgi:endonuclease-3